MKPTPTPNSSIPDYLLMAWPHLPFHLRIYITLRVFFSLHPPRPIPPPIQHSLAISAIAFIILVFLPTHPLAIPTALGLSAGICLVIRP